MEDALFNRHELNLCEKVNHSCYFCKIGIYWVVRKITSFPPPKKMDLFVLFISLKICFIVAKCFIEASFIVLGVVLAKF